MPQQLSSNDRPVDLKEAEALLPHTGLPEHEKFQIRALFPSHLNILASDTVLARECLPSLNDAHAMLAAARESAKLIVQKAQQQAEDMRRNAELEGQLWLDTKRDELLAEMYFQQVLWLSQLQPVWLEALEIALKKVVSDTVRPDAFACAIALGLKEFKKEADLQLFVHPDDLNAAKQALTQLTTASQLMVVSADEALNPGACQIRSPDLEVSLQLDQALSLALGKS